MDAAPTWDLESVVEGGPGGPAFSERCASLLEDLRSLQSRMGELGTMAEDPEGWASAVLQIDPLGDALQELAAFASCFGAANGRSPEARGAEAQADALRQALRSVYVELSATIDEASDADFEAFVSRPDLADAAPALQQFRRGSPLRLSRELEAFKVQLDREALTAWGRQYHLIQGRLEGEIEMEGARRTVGIAELAALRAHADPAVRKAASTASDAAW